jgi:LL-diaminopimelate aminotransferase
MEKRSKIEDKTSSKLKSLEPYLFQKIAQAKEKALSSGIDLIDLGAGNPDLIPTQKIIQSLRQETLNPENHRHPIYEGIPELKTEIAEWFSRRFKVKLDPENEILILGGSKEGLSLAPIVFLNTNDSALVPDPAYPIYKRSVLLAGGKVNTFPLLKENNWLPDLEKIKLKKNTKMIFLNYPNNPTGALSPKEFFQKLVDFACQKDIIICHDMAYSEITFEGIRSHSLLEIEDARKLTLEFFSFSKTYSLTGWRLGFVVGNKDLIKALTQVKVTFSSGVFHPIQRAGMIALSSSEKDMNDLVKTYQMRRDILVKGLKELGWDAEFPKGSIFVWAKMPKRADSMSYSLKLIQKAGVLTTPGIGLGQQGKNYVRFSLTSSGEKIKEALSRMKKVRF